jgi:hypothetical protein
VTEIQRLRATPEWIAKIESGKQWSKSSWR